LPASLTLLLLAVALPGCGKPVPSDKANYVGEWSSLDMHLLITADGRVQYWRQRGATRTSIDAPLQRFEGDDFVVGLPMRQLSTTFEVTRPPHYEDGTWKMVVDGVELTRRTP
jgi:hypothetical protein